MSIIDDVRTYMATYSGLVSGAGLFVDHLPKEPTQYAVMPLPGGGITEHYLDNSSRREFLFAFQSMESTADDPQRIANHAFLESLSEWLEAQNKAGTLPTLDTGKTAEEIEAVGQPILFENGESGTGIYQLQCRLSYAQVAP